MFISTNYRLHREGLGAFFIVLCWSQVGAAQSTELELDYQAPDACGSSGEILEEVYSSLGSAAKAEGWSASITIVEKDAQSFRLQFSARKSEIHSERELMVDSCGAAVEASSLLLLLAIDPSAVERLEVDAKAAAAVADEEFAEEVAEDEEEIPTETSAAQESKAKEEKAQVRSSSGDTSRKLDLWSAAFILLNTGESVTVAPGAKVEFGVGLGPLALSAGGSWLARTQADIPDVSGAQVSSYGLGAHLSLWGRFGKGALRVGPYLGAGFQWLDASVSGISDPSAGGSTLWPTLIAGGRAGLEVSESIDLLLDLGAVVPLQRPEFSVEGIGVVHQAQPAAFEASLGLSWNFFSQ